MNYLKHKADRLRGQITRDHCPSEELDAIERLLEESTACATTWYRCFPNWRLR